MISGRLWERQRTDARYCARGYPMLSSEDQHYYRDRERQCREAAATATDPSVRAAHLQLAQFYARRLKSDSQESSSPTR